MKTSTPMAMNDESLFCREDVYGDRHYYNNVWEKILDRHYPECPTAVSSRKQLKSTLCYCKQIEDAETAAVAEITNDPCLRCHQSPEFCKCGARAQFI